MLSEEFLSHIDSVIESAMNIEYERERYFMQSIREEQLRHKLVYTSEELKKLRFG